MSVIQNIRDKYAKWAVVAIVLSLLGFILMDAFAGRSNLFNGFSDTIGQVNGEKIEAREFELLVKNQEEAAKQQGVEVNEGTRQQIIESVWNAKVSEVLLKEEYEELGLTVTDKELRDMVYGNNPPEALRSQFTDPQTGQYNPTAAQQQINQLRRTGSPEQRAQVNQFFEALAQERLQAKYTSLLSNTNYVPKWFVEKQNVDNSLTARVSFVSVPYGTISDSTVKVSDDEIRAYMKEHEEEFKQDMESRSIDYVVFSGAPSAADSAAARNALTGLKASFDTVTAASAASFVQSSNSPLPYFNSFISGNAIQNPMKDSILAAPTGQAYGPYLDGNNFVLSKIIERRQWPDTVKVRHILVATSQRTPDGQTVPTRDQASARRLIDSIQQLHKSGTSFDTLVARYSDDPGSKSTGGVYDNITTGQMVPQFNDYIFSNPTGSTGVVETDFGFHYIEVLSQKGSTPAYKIAYVAREIVPSPETESSASNAANAFAANVRDAATFNSAVAKELAPKGINKLTADVRSMDFSVQGLGASRAFIKSVFEAEKGDVIGPEEIEGNYVVGVITSVDKAGLVSVERARTYVEPLVRNRKKAEIIRKNLGTVTSLEAAAQKTGQQIQVADSLQFSGAGNSPLGFEQKVVGAAFNPANRGKLVAQAIEGTQAVYVIRVDAVGTVPVQGASVEDQRRTIELQARQRYATRQPVEVLKELADIKDNRTKFY